MHKDIQQMIRQRIQVNEFMQGPKTGQNKRIVISLTRSPNILESEGTDDDWVLR